MTPKSQNETLQKDLLDLLSGRQGHYKLESGYHGDLWFDLDRLYLQASSIRRFVLRLASQLSKYSFDAVCGPLSGGAFLAQAIAAELDLEFYYTERFVLPNPGGLYPVEYHLPKGLRKLAAGKEFAIVDDIINAGSAARGTLTDLQQNGAKPVVVAALLMLGSAGPTFFNSLNMPMESVAQLPSGMWEPAACPLCASQIPLEDPYLE
jgi:orotate phosphoribosyltransferase